MLRKVGQIPLKMMAAKIGYLARILLPWILIVLFSYWYMRLAYLNELHLRNGIDLGTYNQILYNLSTGEMPPFNSLKGQIAWGDHAHFIMLLFVPLYLIWSSPYLLLTVQVLVLTTSAWPIYRIALKKLRSMWLAGVICSSYLTFFGVQYAIDFDFHANTLTAAALAWWLYAYSYRKWWLYWGMLLVGLLTREDAATFFIAICIYWLIFSFKKRWKLAAVTGLVALVYFFTVSYFIMPKWTPGGGALNYFDAVGENRSPVAIVWWFITNPVQIIQEFTSDGKHKTLRALAQSYGYMPLFSPFTYLAVLPNLLARFLSEEYQRHGLSFHYNASLVSVLAFGAILGVQNLQRLLKKISPSKVMVGGLNVALSLVIMLGVYGVSWKDPDLPLHKLSAPEFVSPEFQPVASHPALEIVKTMIPRDKSVAASSGLVPWLSDRPFIYNFPDPLPKQPMWVVLSPEFNTWPLPKGEVLSYIDEFQQNESFKMYWSDYGIYVFKRIK